MKLLKKSGGTALTENSPIGVIINTAEDMANDVGQLLVKLQKQYYDEQKD